MACALYSTYEFKGDGHSTCLLRNIRKYANGSNDQNLMVRMIYSRYLLTKGKGMNLLNIPLIPRKVLFDNPDRTKVEISPDGMRLSWLAPLDGVLNVWVAPRANPENAHPVTHDKGRGIRYVAPVGKVDNIL